ncbi:hypothetical protein D3C87_1303330 [compost metagenome]
MFVIDTHVVHSVGRGTQVLDKRRIGRRVVDDVDVLESCLFEVRNACLQVRQVVERDDEDRNFADDVFAQVNEIVLGQWLDLVEYGGQFKRRAKVGALDGSHQFRQHVELGRLIAGLAFQHRRDLFHIGWWQVAHQIPDHPELDTDIQPVHLVHVGNRRTLIVSAIAKQDLLDISQFRDANGTRPQIVVLAETHRLVVEKIVFNEQLASQHGRGMRDIAAHEHVGIADILHVMMNGITVHELLKLRAAHPHVEMLIEKRYLLSEPRRFRDVIRIHACYEFTSCFAKSKIQRSSKAFARPFQHCDASIVIATDEIQSAVC